MRASSPARSTRARNSRRSACGRSYSLYAPGFVMSFIVSIVGQIFAAQQEHQAVAGARLQPGDRQARERALDLPPMMSGLDHEQSARPKEAPGVGDDPPHEREPVAPAGERDPRLAS